MRGRAHFPYLLLTDVLAGLVLLAHLAFASDIPGRESTPGLGEPAETVRFQLYQGYLIVSTSILSRSRSQHFPGHWRDPCAP